MKISFSKRAVKNYSSILEYLSNEWGERVAGAFNQRTNDFLDLLERFPEIGSVEMIEKQIRGFQLTKHTRLFYRIKGENIILLAFFNVRQHPNKRPQ